MSLPAQRGSGVILHSTVLTQIGYSEQLCLNPICHKNYLLSELGLFRKGRHKSRGARIIDFILADAHYIEWDCLPKNTKAALWPLMLFPMMSTTKRNKL